MQLPIRLGLRYTRAKRKNHFISFISLVSTIGIALGVAVLITVLSVMNGFDEQIKTRILSMVPHVTVSSYGEGISDWSLWRQRLIKLKHVKGVAPVVNGQGMLSANGSNGFAIIQGIDPKLEKTVLPLASKMVSGRLSDLKTGHYGIVLGQNMAENLGVDLGSKLLVVVPSASLSPVGFLPRLKQVTVVGIFHVGYQFDSSYALMNINDAARVFNMPGKVSGLQLRLDNLYLAPQVVSALTKSLPLSMTAMDWTAQNPNLFQALKMEKTMMFFILLLIIAVAVFNMLSTLVMLVTDKQADIAILRTMGMSSAGIINTFIVQGMITGGMGIIFGVIGGVALAFNVTEIVNFIQNLFHVQFLSSSVYYIDFVPSKVEWVDVVHITLAALLMSFIATLYPAWRASRIQPAEVLRYE
ncbi:lipoprotein-releasing ABC transporter permease subunit [Piscirickettsia salmonis]|uniref:lipoprotein-releasing ABC transporter permease subunit n=1 Tax=Piscirickettsia salmonis TaxID=1238 RepID=UPI0007C9583F|nr:Lipoprotein-releasing system transmembrane protein LolE [Piscirickettsiaceae bacterium NZ-RLO1]